MKINLGGSKMVIKHKWISVIVTLAAVLLGVVTPFSAFAQENISVGILQYVEHDSLNQTREGFIDGLAEAGYVEGENLTLNYLNAAADNANLQTMSETLSNDNDYLFAIATPAAQSLANVESETPIYFSAVSDPVGSGLVESLETPGKNVTGTTDAGPIEEQVELLISIVPEAETVGIIYNSGEANSKSEAEKAIAVMEEKGLSVLESTVISTNDISQAMNALVGNVDAVFTVTDNTIASAMPLVGDMAIEADLPLVGGSKDMALENGLTTYGLDYYELGKQTAQMLVRQIEEEMDTAEIPVESAAVLELVVNETYAQAIGIDPSSIQISSEDTNPSENNQDSVTTEDTQEETESAETDSTE